MKCSALAADENSPYKQKCRTNSGGPLVNTVFWLEEQAFSLSNAVAPSASPPLTSPSRQQVVSLSQSVCVSPDELTDGKGGGKGWCSSLIIRRWDSLVLYNPLNTLWLLACPWLCHYRPSPSEYTSFTARFISTDIFENFSQIITFQNSGGDRRSAVR